MNFGSAMIKMFQIIEILGKLLYLPVYFQGLLLNVLYSVEQLSSLVSLPSDLIFANDRAQKNRYWTKFTIYQNQENVFQSEVIASIALSVTHPIYYLTPVDFPRSLLSAQGPHIDLQDLPNTQKNQQNCPAGLLPDTGDDRRGHHFCCLLQPDYGLQIGSYGG